MAFGHNGIHYQENVFYPNAAKSNFSHALHALRGLAALIVFGWHLMAAINVHIFQEHGGNANPFNGSGAVTFFYVLSGFVIAASIAKYPIGVHFYNQYMIKRLFRIMPLMVVTVTLGGLYLFFIDKQMRFPFLEEGFGELTIPKFISAYVGYSLKPNPPIWSVFVELVASALLPFMVLTGARKPYIYMTGAVLLVFALFNLNFQHHWNFYMIDFYIGVSILWWGPKLAEMMGRQKRIIFWAIMLALFALFYLPRKIFADVFGNPYFNLVEVVPVALITACVYYLPVRFMLFTKPVFQFFGDISFSLYLTHSLLIILVLNGLPMVFPLLLVHPVIFAALCTLVTIPLCFAVSRLSYRWIEQPGMDMGKIFSKIYRTMITNPDDAHPKTGSGHP